MNSNSNSHDESLASFPFSLWSTDLDSPSSSINTCISAPAVSQTLYLLLFLPQKGKFYTVSDCRPFKSFPGFSSERNTVLLKIDSLFEARTLAFLCHLLYHVKFLPKMKKDKEKDNEKKSKERSQNSGTHTRLPILFRKSGFLCLKANFLSDLSHRPSSDTVIPFQSTICHQKHMTSIFNISLLFTTPSSSST